MPRMGIEERKAANEMRRKIGGSRAARSRWGPIGFMDELQRFREVRGNRLRDPEMKKANDFYNQIKNQLKENGLRIGAFSVYKKNELWDYLHNPEAHGNSKGQHRFYAKRKKGGKQLVAVEIVKEGLEKKLSVKFGEIITR